MAKQNAAWLTIILILFTAWGRETVSAAAYRQPMYNNGMETQADPRKQQLQEQARAAAQKMDEILQDTYSAVNELKEPDASQMTFAGRLLDASRRCVIEFNDAEKASYFLLQGWLDYTKDDLSGAIMNSGRACRLDGTDSDAWVSQQYFSFLNDQRPFRPRPQRNDPFSNGTVSQSLYGSGGTLRFNPESIRNELLGRELSAFQAADVTGRNIRYQPGRNMLCVLVWQLDNRPAAAETNNTPAPAPAADPDPLAALLGEDNGGNAGMEPAMAPATPAGPVEPEGYDQQAGVLDSLKDRLPRSANIKFLGLCTNADTDRPDVVDFVRRKDQGWPQLMAVDAPALQALRTDARSAFVTLIDEQGHVRFAGSAEGFMLPMLLKKVAGVRFVNRQAAQANWRGGMVADPNRPVVDPNHPVDPNRPFRAVVDPNRPIPTVPAPNSIRPVQPTPAPVTTPQAQTPAAATTQPQEKEYRQLPMEEQVQAEKLMTYTRDLFMKMGQRRFMSYKRGVELCRQIIRDYPGTVYEAEARQLLREVPENQRDRYNITNEELGQ